MVVAVLGNDLEGDMLYAVCMESVWFKWRI